MDKVTLIAPCHFGLEAVLKREITDLGYEIEKVEDGRVTFCGDISAICRANIFLRTAERILLKVGQFKAVDFDSLFEQTKSLPWEDYIPQDGKVWVTKAASVKSKLFSTVTIQSMIKKAIASRLCGIYHVNTLPETGAEYPLRVFLMKDEVTISLDTSGEPLHKRGYRQLTAKAPIAETMAAALIMLTPWKQDRIFVDPFCGSGTFPIEAAMIGANIAPGMNREFDAEKWNNIISRRHWYDAVNEANDIMIENPKLQIYGSDIDPAVLKLAKGNAREAGVFDQIHFSVKSAEDLSLEGDYGFIVTNPPYGQRLEDIESVKKMYQSFGRQFSKYQTWSLYMISSLEETETCIGRKADKKRKLYNGMLKTNFYQFQGQKPPRRTEEKGKAQEESHRK